MWIFVALLFGALFVAYANGANDNFKGVATLYGSGTVSYRVALGWATITTMAGSLLSVFLADALVKAFSAKGLVPDEVAARPEFLAAVALAAALTVFAATLTGFPISTTHALTGALMGAGLMEVGGAVSFARLGKTFFLPLLASPVVAVVFAGLAFAVARWFRTIEAFQKDYCVCVGDRGLVPPTVHASPSASASASASVAAAIETPTHVGIVLGDVSGCATHAGPSLVLKRDALVSGLHFLSSGAVSFARGLNDAPKIVGLLVAFEALHLQVSLTLIAALMALGGLVHARKVAETVSRRITRMSQAEGLIANLVTSVLVLTASTSGLPVSTTHVSCSSIFGMGLVTGKADRGVIRQILLSWAFTLPLAAALAACAVLVSR